MSFQAKSCELLLRGSDRSFFSGLLNRSGRGCLRNILDRNSLNDWGLRGSRLRCKFRLRLRSGLGLRSERLRLFKRLLRCVAGLLGLSKRLLRRVVGLLGLSKRLLRRVVGLLRSRSGLSAIRLLGRTKWRLRCKSRLRG